MNELDAYARLAERMADAVRPVVLRYFRDPVAFEIKDDLSPVTAADREAETTMRRLIERECPAHGILGEEHGAWKLDATWVWVLDPIDGTKSFVTGKPLFGTLIALLRDGEPVLGVIDMPALGERWLGVEGGPARFNGQPVRCRPCPRLERAWIYATTPDMFVGENDVAFTRLRRHCYASVFGADLYAYGLVANGRVDLVCEGMLKPYDYCAAVPVITAAGGVITDWRGAPLGLGSDGRVIAAGDPGLHALALAELAG